MTTGRAIREALTPIAVLLFIAAIGFLGTQCIVGCTPPPEQTMKRIDNAAAVAQYDAALVDCKEKAKAAHDFAVFEACEARVSTRLCIDRASLRAEWPRCAALGVLP